MCLGIKAELGCLFRQFLLYKSTLPLNFFHSNPRIGIACVFPRWTWGVLQLGSHSGDTEKLPFACQPPLWSSSKAPVTPREGIRRPSWCVRSVVCCHPCFLRHNQIGTAVWCALGGRSPSARVIASYLSSRELPMGTLRTYSAASAGTSLLCRQDFYRKPYQRRSSRHILHVCWCLPPLFLLSRVQAWRTLS